MQDRAAQDAPTPISATDLERTVDALAWKLDRGRAVLSKAIATAFLNGMVWAESNDGFTANMVTQVTELTRQALEEYNRGVSL